MMEGRRYSEGLHQALEAKEGVTIQNENQTLASITFQNYFRLYPEARRHDRHGDDRGGPSSPRSTSSTSSRSRPTCRCIRVDHDDEVYRTAAREDTTRSSTQIEECRAREQPVLVGTVSIEKSEALSELLQEAQGPAPGAERPLSRAGSLHHRPGRPAGRRHHRHQHGRPRHRHPARRQSRHARCARSWRDIDDAGRARGRHRRRSAPRSTRRAKRCAQAGGLFVIGTERHESRRIDNQLRGRSGRQGDPGASKFFVSLEDDLMRIFGSRAHGRDAAAARPQGRRGDHPSLDQQGAGEGAAEGRGAQLRDPQAPAAIRRRDERPAQGDLSSSAARS